MIKIYEIPQEKLENVKKVLEAEEKKDEEGDIKINNFARNGYILRDGKILGSEEDVQYLYIEADEDFFDKNEADLPEVKTLEGEKFQEIKKKIEAEENNTAAGVGIIFGDE